MKISDEGPATVPAPHDVIYRIARHRDVAAFPALDRAAQARFGDPKRRTSVIYAARDARIAYVESLQEFRVEPKLLALLKQHETDPLDVALRYSVIPDWWFNERWLGTLQLSPRDTFLDLRRLRTREYLRVVLAEQFAEHGLEDFDLGDAVSRRRDVTQLVSDFAVSEGFKGIAYTSRFAAHWDCWAIFQTANVTVSHVRSVSKDDPDLEWAAGELSLSLETEPGESDEQPLDYDSESGIQVETVVVRRFLRDNDL